MVGSRYSYAIGGLANIEQGFPLSEVDLSHTINAPVAKVAGATSKGLSDITPVRSRIFYAKPAITAKGLIQPGYKHIREFIAKFCYFSFS